MAASERYLSSSGPSLVAAAAVCRIARAGRLGPLTPAVGRDPEHLAKHFGRVIALRDVTLVDHMLGDTTPAIRLEHLAKRFGGVIALRDVTLDVLPGEVFGFLGLNGAGKTTTIRIVLDLVRPTSGRASVFGRSCQRDGRGVRARVGYLPGELGLYPDMTGAETLDLLGNLGASAIDARVRRALVERFELSQRDLRRPIREYSTGMKRKLGIVQAFQSEPSLLILDEPTEGLDPLMQEALYQLLEDMKGQGRTIFMSSHVLPEVERVCDRIGLLRQGELVLMSPTVEIRGMAARGVRIVFRQPVSPPAVWPANCDVIELAANRWNLKVQGSLAPLLSMLSPLPVDDVFVQEPHLEDVLRTYYRGGANA